MDVFYELTEKTKLERISNKKILKKLWHYCYDLMEEWSKWNIMLVCWSVGLYHFMLPV